MPYFAGLKSALWRPMAPTTTSRRLVFSGATKRKHIPVAMSTTSTAFMARMTLLFENRSARSPAGSENSIKGSVKITNASVV